MPVREHRLLALLSGDVVGYSRLIAADQDGTISTLATHREQISRTVVSNHGRLVDFTGDNFLAEFGSALHAVRCAAAIQHAIHRQYDGRAPDECMYFRIGAHVGDVRIEGDRIYGEAVVIASRLEGVSEPGGICLSQQLVDQIGDRAGFSFTDLGEQHLKNIAYPVRAYGVPARDLVNEPPILQSDKTTGDAPTAHYRGIPVIAVLPLTSISSAAEDEQLVDGITSDVISGLSFDKRFSVVSYSSMAAYKQLTTDVSAVGQELGARYVVAGNVRRHGERIRLSVALTEVETRRELWSGKLDRELTDIFSVLDEIVEAVVTALSAHLMLAEDERFRRKPPDHLDAWALAARASNYTHNQMTLRDALEMVGRALEIDPDYGFAWAVLAYLTALKFPLGFSTDHASDIAQSLAAAEEALKRDIRDPYALTAQAIALQYAGRARESMEFLQRSLRLNPSDALTHCYYGRGLIFTGRPDLALAHFERFNELNLNDSGNLMGGMYHSIALVLMQQWGEAERVARRANAAAGGRNPWTLVMLMIALGAQGKFGQAKEVLAQLGKIAPHWTPRFVEEFFLECQEDHALLPPMFSLLRSVWPDSVESQPQSSGES